MNVLPHRLLLTNLLRGSTISLFIRSFLAALGLIAGISGLASGFSPDLAKKFGLPVIIGAVTVAFFYAAWIAWPRSCFSRNFTIPQTKISVVVGDLFTQDGHLVIGMTDTFDTQTPSIISAGSVQGQFLIREYHGDTVRLDADLAGALAGCPVIATETRQAKPLGKLARYSVGTVAVLGTDQRRYYGLAYSKMRNDYVAESSVSNIWNSLMALWPVVRVTSDLGTVSITAVGLGLARLSGQISQADMVHLIIISFLTAFQRDGGREPPAYRPSPR